MARVKTQTTPAAKKPEVATEAVKTETKAVAAEVKAEPEKKVEAAKTEPEKKEAAKEVKAEAKKTTAKKTTAKKETVKKEATEKKTTTKKAEVKATINFQFDGKSYTTEDLIKITKDVWKYDLGKKTADLKTVDLYVKPEESQAYYVINGEVTGSFGI